MRRHKRMYIWQMILLGLLSKADHVCTLNVSLEQIKDQPKPIRLLMSIFLLPKIRIERGANESIAFATRCLALRTEFRAHSMVDPNVRILKRRAP